MEDHPGDVAATGGDGHMDCGLGQLRSRVTVREGQVEQPPREQVLDGPEEHGPLAGADLFEVPSPFLVASFGAEIAAQQIGRGPGTAVGAGEAPRRGCIPCRPWRAIEASTVFFDTR